uniref:Uncharacterized protein n=1 Tax=viral metagenome TaxID=1070528 RepID=A0A6C0F964_9ZZZZ|tara:strand:- start:218 stop:367 length:150 start_codon:yes stop_codon:yes gene_type:complete
MKNIYDMYDYFKSLKDSHQSWADIQEKYEAEELVHRLQCELRLRFKLKK